MSHLQCEHGRSRTKREVKSVSGVAEILGAHRPHVNAASASIRRKIAVKQYNFAGP